MSKVELTQYLTLHEVLELHRLTLQHHGGSEGVRDLGLVQSALYFGGRSRSDSWHFQSFCMNHAFVDGNKRVGFLVTLMFLRFNKVVFQAPQEEVVRFIVDDLIVKKADLKQIAQWLLQHSK